MIIAYGGTREEKKILRAQKVDSTIVSITRDNGTVIYFDGDEKSWLRLAVIGLLMKEFGEPSTTWGMADNENLEVTWGEMLQAAALAIREMGAVWFI